MKKQLIVLLVFCCFTGTLAASENIDLYGATDLAIAQSFFYPHIYASVAFGALIEEDFAVEVPLSIYFDRSGGSEILLDSSINVIVYPFDQGPYLSLSLVKLLFFVGSFTPHEALHYLSSLAIGYRWQLDNTISLSPQITLLDPSQMYEESLSYIQGFIPSIRKLSFSLFFQYNITSLGIDE